MEASLTSIRLLQNRTEISPILKKNKTRMLFLVYHRVSFTWSNAWHVWPRYENSVGFLLQTTFASCTNSQCVHLHVQLMCRNKLQWSFVPMSAAPRHSVCMCAWDRGTLRWDGAASGCQGTCGISPGWWHQVAQGWARAWGRYRG